ncbi:Histone H1.2 [Lucilia cuprina]|nr:Histone H1.2 [Lucilia cuprina]
MNTNDQNQNGSLSAEIYVPFIPMTPKSSDGDFIREHHQSTKNISTKNMMKQAIKALAQNSRKGFSLASIRKYIMDNFLHTASDLKHRMPFMKKIFKTALETGEVVSVKGIGLNGSFRVPATSPLHKNAKKNKKNKERQKRKTAKKVNKRFKVKQGPALKPKKVKKAKRTFSAKI